MFLNLRTFCRDFFHDFMVSFRQYAMVYIVAFAITVLSIVLNHAVGGGYFFIEDTDHFNVLLQSLVFTLPLTLIGPIMKVIRPSFSRWHVYLLQLLALVAWWVFYFLVSTPTRLTLLSLFTWRFSWPLPLVIVIIMAIGWKDTTIRWWCNRFVASSVIALWYTFIVFYGTVMVARLIYYLFDFNIRKLNISFDMAVFSRFIIGVIIFLMRLQSHGKVSSYSKIFRFISLYILTPLALLHCITAVWGLFLYSFFS